MKRSSRTEDKLPAVPLAKFTLWALTLALLPAVAAQGPPVAAQQNDETPLSAPPPTAPSPEEARTIIEAARQNALRYTGGLPNFFCTETVARYEDSGKGPLKLLDTLSIAMRYNAGGEQYRLEKVDGRATNRTLAQAGGFRSRGDFGSTLRSVFAPEAQAEFHWQRWTQLRGRIVHVFSYEVAQTHSAYRVNWVTSRRQYRMIAAFRGLVFVDVSSREIWRVSSEAVGVPADWPVKRNYGILDYDYFEVAGLKFLLPSRVESGVVLQKGQNRNIAEFGAYRKFNGDAKISFEGDDSEPD